MRKILFSLFLIVLIWFFYSNQKKIKPMAKQESKSVNLEAKDHSEIASPPSQKVKKLNTNEMNTKEFLKNFEKDHKELCEKRNANYKKEKKVCESLGRTWSCFMYPSCLSLTEGREILGYLQENKIIGDPTNVFLEEQTKKYCLITYGNESCLLTEEENAKVLKCKILGEDHVWVPKYQKCSKKNERQYLYKEFVKCIGVSEISKPDCFKNIENSLSEWAKN